MLFVLILYFLHSFSVLISLFVVRLNNYHLRVFRKNLARFFFCLVMFCNVFVFKSHKLTRFVINSDIYPKGCAGVLKLKTPKGQNYASTRFHRLPQRTVLSRFHPLTSCDLSNFVSPSRAWRMVYLNPLLIYSKLTSSNKSMFDFHLPQKLTHFLPDPNTSRLTRLG